MYQENAVSFIICKVLRDLNTYGHIAKSSKVTWKDGAITLSFI